MKTAVVTDSTAYLSDEEIAKYNIKVIPMPVIIDGTTYKEGLDISTEEFYEKMRNSKELPSTSQPPLGEVIQFYDNLASEGYDEVISIHLASTISGFINTLKTVAPTIESIKVIPYDSQITVKLMGYMAIEAAKMANRGEDSDAIIKRLDQLRATTNEVFIVNDLNHLVKGGRLSNASAVIGGMLSIKPLLTFDDESHKIVAYDKVRSIKKAYQKALEEFKNDQERVDYPLRLIVIHANNEEEAERWADEIKEELNDDTNIEIGYFGPVIGTHLGEKAMALGWMEDIEK